MRNFLAKAGIKPKNGYATDELNSITNYVKHMDNTERTSDNVKAILKP